MRFVKLFAIVLLSLAIIVNVFIWFLWSGLERTGLDPVYYDHIVGNTDIVPIIHERVHGELPDILNEHISESILLEINNLTEEQILTEESQSDEAVTILLNIYSDSLAQAFSSSWLEEQSLISIKMFLRYSEGNQDAFDETIDLSANILNLKQLLAVGIINNFQVGNDLHDDLDDSFLAGLISVLAIPEHLYLRDFLTQADIISETEELLLALDNFRRLMVFWPSIIYILIVLLLIFLIGPGRALIWSGSVTLLFSLLSLVVLIISRFIFTGMRIFATLVFYDNQSLNLVEVFEYIGQHTITLIIPLLYLPFFLALFLLAAGKFINIRVLEES